MPLRFRVALGESFFGGDFDDIAVLGVDLNETAESLGGAQHLEDRLVIDLQDVLVRHEDLERVDAFTLDHGLDLLIVSSRRRRS